MSVLLVSLLLTLVMLCWQLLCCVFRFRLRRLIWLPTLMVLVLLQVLLLLPALGLYLLPSSAKPLAELHFNRVAPEDYVVTLFRGDPLQPKGSWRLQGQQWRLDLRVVRPSWSVVPVGPWYRFERLQGRYESVAMEQAHNPSVHDLTQPVAASGAWRWLQRWSGWVPGLEPQAGLSVYQPMADGAAYAVYLGQGGLTSRPSNRVAAQAVSNWK